MVAEEIRVRSLISLGVSGSSAPSMTARVLDVCRLRCGEACTIRSISATRTEPVRISVA